MAKLPNRSPATGWWTITILLLLLLLQQSIVMVRPEEEQHEGKLRLGDDGVSLRIPPGDGYLRVAGGGEGSSFKVALFADLHFGEDAWTEWGPEQDRKSVNVMSTILDIERPDFVIYLGDVVTANNLPIQNATFYWDQAVSPARARATPWATVFGNHDDAPFEWPIDWFSSSKIPQILCPFANSYRGEECSFKGTTRLQLTRNEKEHNSLSYTRFGPQDLWPSVSNYVLKLLSSKNDPKLPVLFMYFLDSGGGSYPEVISSAQSKWFHEKSREMNPNSSVPEIVLWHIPSKAYVKVGKKTSSTRTQCVGSMFKERVAPQEAEMGMMKLLRERPSVKAIFVGHNHGLDWCCPYEKMWLCYARHTGYGGYGNWSRGVRILEITEQPFSLKSWIRMEDGSSHSEVLLCW